MSKAVITPKSKATTWRDTALAADVPAASISGANQMTIQTKYVEDAMTGDLVVHRTSDVEPILEDNKRLFNLNDGYTPSRELRRVASVPMVIIEKWKNELGVDAFDPNHKLAVRKLLNSSEYLYLRTAPGRL
jgi:hypothetical protein